MSSGPTKFAWKFLVNHVTKDYKYYITRVGWDVAAPLTRATFETAPFCVVDGGMTEPPALDEHTCNVPTREGYHIILSVWDVGDTSNSFFNVIDAMFSGGGSPPVPVPVPVPTALCLCLCRPHLRHLLSCARCWRLCTACTLRVCRTLPAARSRQVRPVLCTTHTTHSVCRVHRRLRHHRQHHLSQHRRHQHQQQQHHRPFPSARLMCNVSTLRASRTVPVARGRQVPRVQPTTRTTHSACEHIATPLLTLPFYAASMTASSVHRY